MNSSFVKQYIPGWWLGTQTLALLAVTLVVVAGCEEEPARRGLPTLEQTPQARFDRIVASLRDRLEDSGSSGGRFTYRDASGAGSTVYSYRVEATPKVVKTDDEKIPYRAAIKVTLETSFTALPSGENEEEGSGEEDRERQEEDGRRSDGRGDMDDANDLSGMQVMDNRLIGGQESENAEVEGPRRRGPGISSRVISARDETRYDLIYENDRWRLASPPKADAPASANEAIRLSLKRQG